MRNAIPLLLALVFGTITLTACGMKYSGHHFYDADEEPAVERETEEPKETDQPAEETSTETEPEKEAETEQPEEEGPEGYIDENGEFCLLPPKAKENDLAGMLTVGEEAPDFTLTNSQSGKEVKLSEFRGKTVMLFFWASWCPTCKMACRKNGSLWKMMNVIDENPDSNVMILGVGTGTDDNADTQNAFLKSNGCTWTSGYDDGNAVEDDYGVLGVPTCVVIGGDGKVLTFGRYERDYRDSVLEYLKQSCVQDKKAE